jgi:preprotein translocase subunit SecF
MNYKKILLPLALLVIFLLYLALTSLRTEFSLLTLSLVFLSTFLLTGMMFFIAFRKAMISLSIVLCEFANIIEMLAISQILVIKISSLQIASLFLVLLYSINSNVFLIFKVIRDTEKSAEDRKKDIMKVNLLITGTIVFILLVLFLISFSFIVQIAPILIIGLLFDFVNTSFLTGELIAKVKPNES